MPTYSKHSPVPNCSIPQTPDCGLALDRAVHAQTHTHTHTARPARLGGRQRHEVAAQLSYCVRTHALLQRGQRPLAPGEPLQEQNSVDFGRLMPGGHSHVLWAGEVPRGTGTCPTHACIHDLTCVNACSPHHNVPPSIRRGVRVRAPSSQAATALLTTAATPGGFFAFFGAGELNDVLGCRYSWLFRPCIRTATQHKHTRVYSLQPSQSSRSRSAPPRQPSRLRGGCSTTPLLLVSPRACPSPTRPQAPCLPVPSGGHAR